MDPRHTIIAALALAAAYFIGVEIGFAFTLEPNAVSLLWPPNTIVLAALLLTPVRIWGWLIAAVLPVHLVAQLNSDVPLALSMGWYVTNSTEALLGAGLTRAILERTPRFDVVRDMLVFMINAVIVAPMLTSFLDAGIVASVGWRYDGEYWNVWRMRFFSNALATSVLAPLIVIVGSTSPRATWRTLKSCGAEAGVLFALLAVISWFVFFREYGLGRGATYVYAPLPLIVWAAVRLGVGGVAACVGIVALASLAGEMRGLGPFARALPDVAVSSLQIFLLIAANSLMLLAAALAELKDARATALRRKQSLDLALSAARMGVWDWDLSSEQVRWRWRPRARQMTMTTADVLARIHPDDRTAVVTAMSRALAGESHCEAEFRFSRRGAARWIMMKGKRLREGPGDPHRVIGIFMDTTHWKERDAKELVERNQLAHLSRVAMLGELSGALAHELRQPLAAILFNAQAGLRELAKPAPDSAELIAILEDIVADDTRAGEVIRRLRVLFMRGDVQAELIDVRDSIRAVLALEHSDLIMRNITVDLSLGEVPLVSMDAIQLQQVLLNLIVNACEAMTSVQPSERRLRISAAVESGEVRIGVSDSGPGISNPDKIFDAFYSTKPHSLGLGLAISRTIMGTHGGRLWSTNNPAGGASFHISLPCPQPDKAKAPPEAETV